MGIGIRESKKKSGKVTKSRIMTVYIETGERYSNGRKKYRIIKRALGSIDELTAARAKTIYEDEAKLVKRGKKYAPNVPKLADFIPEYLEYVRTVANKRSWWRDQIALDHLTRYLGNIKLDAITPLILNDYQAHRESMGRTNGTINRELSILRRVYSVARIKNLYMGDNPVSGIQFLYEEQKIDRVLSYEEEDKLMAASPHYLRTILICALNTGMRKNEIITLEWKNVDLNNNYITVESRHTKTKRVRKVPINSTLKEVLAVCNNSAGIKGHDKTHVFLSRLGNPYKAQDSLKKVFNTAVRRSAIDKLRFHDLRHTAATRMIEAGADITDVAEALGHYDIRTTMRYAHPKQSVRQAIESLSIKNRQTKNQTK